MKLTVSGIDFSYDSAPILRSVGLDLEKGQILGIIGPNGSGKTTMIKCINRILTPSRGAILLNGEDVMKMRIRDVAKHMGYVPQNSTNEFSAPTVFEVVMMGRRPHSAGWQSSASDEEIVWNSLRELGVEDLASRPFNRISSGQTQRVLMARAICQNAEILLLDEPTSNLDIRYQIEVMDIIRGLADNKGMGVCAIIHDMDIAMKYCDKIVLLDKGRVIAAGMAEDVLTPENIDMVYGIKIAIDRNYGRPRVIVL